MKVFQNNNFYDFDTFQIWFVGMNCFWRGFAVMMLIRVLDMILIWFQLWLLMSVKILIWSQPIGTISKIVSKPYQNRITIVSKSYQNHIKIVSKSYQRRIKIVDRPKTCLGAVSVSFLEANPSGTKVHPRGIRLSYSNWTIVALFVCPLRLAADEPIT